MSSKLSSLSSSSGGMKWVQDFGVGTLYVRGGCAYLFAIVDFIGLATTLGCFALFCSGLFTLGDGALGFLLFFGLVICWKILLSFVMARICASPGASKGAFGCCLRRALVKASAARVALSSGEDWGLAQL